MSEVLVGCQLVDHAEEFLAGGLRWPVIVQYFVIYYLRIICVIVLAISRTLV